MAVPDISSFADPSTAGTKLALDKNACLILDMGAPVESSIAPDHLSVYNHARNENHPQDFWST